MKNTVKNNIETVYMKEWFYRKNHSDLGSYGEHVCLVLKETEKAYQVSLLGEILSRTTWVPKSCTIATVEERDAEALEAEVRQAEYEARREARWQEACQKYAELIAYAQKLGVRGVREGLRRETIERKIQAAGFPLPA